MKTKLEKAIGDGNIVIPLYILKAFKKLNLSMEEFIFLMYLYNKQDKIDFNPEKIAEDLNIDIMEVMGYISVLTDKGYLELDVIKENNLLEEKINLAKLYEKISMILIDKEEDNKPDGILKYIEEEFGRPISSTEIEMIESWVKNNIEDSLIKEVVKISKNNGILSIKYIDAILFDYKSRGITNINDLQSEKNNIHEEVVENTVEDWDWLEDEEEYPIN